MQRLFFALQPDPVARQRLARLAARLAAEHGGEAVPETNLHVTLCFLGPVSGEQLAQLLRAADLVRTAQLELTFDAVSHWPKPHILCGVGQKPGAPAVDALARHLQQAAMAAGLKPDGKPWRPHVTLVRHVPAGHIPTGMLAEPVVLVFDGFVLMNSERGTAGPSYTALRHWHSPTD